jgi:hypothetical protein
MGAITPILRGRLEDLAIERGETGFIVYENAGTGSIGRKWAFETSVALAEFVASWADKGNENES